MIKKKAYDFREVKGYSVAELAEKLDMSEEKLLSVVDIKLLTRFQERGFDVVIGEKVEDSIIGLKAARIIGKKFFKEVAQDFIDALEVHLILEAHDDKIRREFSHIPSTSEAEKKSH